MSRIVFALALVLFGVSAAQAQQSSGNATPEMKSARQSFRQACAQDIKTLCGDMQPGGGKIMGCLKDHKEQISQGCKDAAMSMRRVRKGGG